MVDGRYTRYWADRGAQVQLGHPVWGPADMTIVALVDLAWVEWVVGVCWGAMRVRMCYFVVQLEVILQGHTHTLTHVHRRSSSPEVLTSSPKVYTVNIVRSRRPHFTVP